jgi:hypothetical protein
MQSLIILVTMAIFSIFMISEMSRNDSANISPAIKAGNVAANIFQYQDAINQYAIESYDELHSPVSFNPGKVEHVKIISYKKDGIINHNQKNLSLFLNYQSILFNYSRALAGESQPMPVLYVATSWSGYATDKDLSGYKNINMVEVMGKLGEDLSKRLYQGNSTYWVIPWIFSQNNCQILELYTQLPDDMNGNSQYSKLQDIFRDFCGQIQANTTYNYRFLTYVYLAPIYIPPNM